MRYVAIDFETATAKQYSICAVGIVTMENGEIVDEYYTLIKPPNNKYDWMTTRVHGIKAKHTKDAPAFPEILPEILKRLKGETIVAHNELFDRGVLRRTALFYHINIQEIDLNTPWECTVKLCQAKGHKKSRLSICSEYYNIELEHHNALSDARACALIYHYNKDPNLFDK